MSYAAPSPEEVLRKTRAVGQYYGFAPLSVSTARGKGGAKSAYPETLSGLTLDPRAEQVASFLKHCRDAGLEPNPRAPLLLWHTNIAYGRPAPKKIVVQFHALGSDHALADALVIRALSALAEDLFGQATHLRVNSMGDKETRARYARELGSFFKRHAHELPEMCTECARRDALEAAELALEEGGTVELPAPTDHLSDASRKRFEDLLEYLEDIGSEYELAHGLLSRGPAWGETCFELTNDSGRVAWGSRYAELARHFFKVPMPATGALIELTSEKRTKLPSAPKEPSVRFAFVHIGDEAKRLALSLAEAFKHARLPLSQDIGVESLTEQMRLAERRNPTYLLIMGRKEALERTTIVRNRLTQEETVLPIEGLVARLEKLA